MEYKVEIITTPTKKEIVEHPKHVIDALYKLNLAHPDYDD